MPHDRTRFPAGQGGVAGEPLLSFRRRPGAFALAAEGTAAPIVCLPGESACVRRAAGDLRADLGAVLGSEPDLLDELPARRTSGGDRLGAALVGTIDANPVFARAEEMGALDLSRVRSCREAYAIGAAEDVLPGGGSALLVAGSDPRGAIYGIYALSAAAGISPWRWWADVPVVGRGELWAMAGNWIGAEPAVRWRGLFLNDEEPCLGGWARRVFGGFNAAFYARFFELVLRLGGNLVWPAMWGKSFDEDDPGNPAVAASYGLVIGSSHHEPMCRAHVEWARCGAGPWSYLRNAAGLREFWRAGAARIGSCERIVTLGMRGDGDEASIDGEDPRLLARVIREQRRILGREAGGADVPQAWVVYKEVQGLYDRGFRPPEDATVVLCDDNWGNLRRLPPADERGRPGGHGVYYHFDYVGGPRSYKWIDTTQAARTWEQLGLAREAGADRLWIANVGDLKPLERQVEFFLELARDPDAWAAEDAAGYAETWAERIFGPVAGPRAGAILARYERLAARRKPELLGPETYSLVAHREADRVLAEHEALASEARELHASVPDEYRSAYLQLVLYPVLALANLHALHAAVARNRLCAAQCRDSAAAWAAEAARLFALDAELSRDYESASGGKWAGMMSQTHIGYRDWAQPESNAMPETVLPARGEGSATGLAVEGSADSWPAPPGAPAGSHAPPELPELDSRLPGGACIELFPRGGGAAAFSAVASAPWLRLARSPGRAEGEALLTAVAEWDDLPVGEHDARISVRCCGPGAADAPTRIEVAVRAYKAPPAPPGWEDAFAEIRGAVAIEAEHFHASAGAPGAAWRRIPALGRTLSAMRVFPGLAGPFEPGAGCPRLEYRIVLRGSGRAVLRAYHSPSLDCAGRGRLAWAVSFDGGPPVFVDARPEGSAGEWERAVSDNALVSACEARLSPGPHEIAYWAIDPALPLQRLVLSFGELPYSYLGPPESPRAGARPRSET